jgi:hypothetical protein
MRAFQPSADLVQLLSQRRLNNLWQQSARDVLEDPVTKAAIRVNEVDVEDAREAVARALIASLLVASEEAGLPGVDGETRERMIFMVLDGLGGKSRGVTSWLKGQLTGIGAATSTFLIKRKRGKLSDAGLPMIGDILLYQTRGREIRSFIRKRIMDVAQQGPSIILAHSLGGIACVDLLQMEKLPVTHLITCGSQAPLLYEINSLTCLEYKQPLREDFPAWLNVYDPNDFLSYVAAKVFPRRVTDYRVESKQPFPQSHRAYWGNRKVWTKIQEFVQ